MRFEGGGKKNEEDKITVSNKLQWSSRTVSCREAESSYLILNHSLKVKPIKFAKFDKRKKEELSRD